jgi:hypothetical protein
MDLQKLIARMDQIEAKGIVEAGDPEGYAQAQAAMARLEKAAKYTGDDEIVRGRMGLPPKLPPIEQWDGKMPEPVGKPDWFSRLTTMGGSTTAQAQAAALNTAEKGSLDQSNAILKQIADLTAKLNAMATATTKEGISFKSMMAKQLTESFGYNLSEEGEDKQAIIKQLQDLTRGFRDTEDEKILAVINAADQAINKAQSSATTPGQTATPTPGGPSSQDLTGAAGAAGEAVGKKLQRFKELLAKASGKPAAPATAATAAPAAGGANPLAADPISANAKPKAESQLSEAEKYAALRDRLLMIETRVDEGPLDFAKGVYNAGKGMFQAAKTGFSGAPVATGKLTKAGAAQTTSQGSKQFAKQLAKAPAAQRAAYNTAKVVKANPVKTALGATAVGAGAAYALSGDAKKPEADVVTPPKVPGQTGTPVPVKPNVPAKPTAPESPYTPEETAELDMLAREFGDSEDPEIAALLKQYSDVKNSALK